MRQVSDFSFELQTQVLVIMLDVDFRFTDVNLRIYSRHTEKRGFSSSEDKETYKGAATA